MGSAQETSDENPLQFLSSGLSRLQSGHWLPWCSLSEFHLLKKLNRKQECVERQIACEYDPPKPALGTDSSQILGSCNQMAFSHAQVSVALLE